jgi:mono/diheme cytochrome c family protein
MSNNSPVAALLAVVLGLAACDKPAEKPPDATASASPVTAPRAAVPDTWLKPEQISRGRLVYGQHCLKCHGAEGKGQPGDWRVRKPNGLYPPPPLDDTAHAWHHPTVVLRKAILKGSPPDMGDMPPWQGRLTDDEIDDVIVYIKSLWSPEIYRQWMEIEMRSLEN